MTLLAADQLDWYVGKPWAMIIDVRSRREYEKGHVKGAVNLPYDHLLERIRGQNGHRRNACIPRTISGGGRRAVRGQQSNISSCQAGKDTVR